MSAASEPGDDVQSPCINVCTIDPSTGLCGGCLRTLDEIAGWSAFDAERKRAVLRRLAERRARRAEDRHAGSERR